ncbi:single-stranded DNA-binding protein [Azohydromonas caseinilytica]|uniref:Single-stranded DNA-binding protein n=1 Tax=Azohydromonas caseinilytica TaxID=2728836 RepID=A0A848FG62_9BURK|nr:single-stranded DNA-binding protein [Azohydromonas caseinilytica]NML18126.1 single-stranded DNA-binding protein [Azohydromonas caseinilytica]
MIEGLVSGKVYGRPEQRVGTNSGKPFATAKVRAATSNGETLFVNVLAFDATAQAALLALSDGDAVSLAGTLTPKVWTDREGQARPALDMVASQVLTAYQVKRKRDAVSSTDRPLGQKLPASQDDDRAPVPPAAAAQTDEDAPWN